MEGNYGLQLRPSDSGVSGGGNGVQIAAAARTIAARRQSRMLGRRKRKALLSVRVSERAECYWGSCRFVVLFFLPVFTRVAACVLVWKHMMGSLCEIRLVLPKLGLVLPRL